MAFYRPLKLKSAAYTSGGSQAIPGVTRFGLGFSAETAQGGSGSDIGDSCKAVTGWSGRGFIEVDNLTVAGTLAALGTVPLAVVYSAQLSSTAAVADRTLSIDNVNFGGAEEFQLPANSSEGTVMRYRVPFEVVWGASDTKPSDVIAFS